MNHRRYTYLVGEDILLLKRRYTSFLKETHRSFIRSGMGALLLWLLLLTACVGEELQKPLLGEGEGYLTLQIGAISAEVTSDPLTKATLENLPASADFAITIKDANNTEVKHYEKLSQIENPLVLKAGVTYTVEASHGKNEALQDTPYFFDSKKVTIQANTNNPVSLKPSLGNAMITPVVSESLKQHYNNDWTLTASTNNTAEPFPLTFTNGTCTFYAKAGETVSLNFTGTNKAGETANATWTSISNVEACKAYTVECKPDLAAFYNIQVTATATHTTDASGYLNGTDVVLNNNLNGANENAIETWNVEVKYNGTTIRSYSGSAPNNLTMTQTAGWPYIPQDSELSASVTLKSGDVIAVGRTFAVPEPKFEVEVSGETSYSVYRDTNRGAAEANTKDGSSIFDIKSSVSISEEILRKYPELLPDVTYSENVDNATTSAALGTSASLSNLSWALHQLTASVTFDNTTKTSKAYPCDVTGLPYALTNSTTDVPNAFKHPANTGNHPWYIINSGAVLISSFTKFEADYIHLENRSGISGGYPSVGSPAFYLPENVNALLNTYINIHGNKFLGVWSVTDFEASINGNTYSIEGTKANDAYHTLKEALTIAPTGNQLILKSKYDTRYGPSIDIYTVSLIYN